MKFIKELNIVQVQCNGFELLSEYFVIAIEQQWIPKSLRFKPPGNHPIFKHIMERASEHCMRARISICHSQIRTIKTVLDDSTQRFSSLVTNDISSAMSQFLKRRTHSVRNTIDARHTKKFTNLSKETDTNQSTPVKNDKR